MLEEQIQSKRLRWIVRFSCAVVKLPVYGIRIRNLITTILLIVKKQSFLIEGYQAGILGGVQDTKPFRSAIGVCPVFPFVHRDTKENHALT
jgi:hypothetical protein